MMGSLASLRPFRSARRLGVAAPFLAAILIFPAAAETAPASKAQTGSSGVITEWGTTGSAPQTGSSAHTSGKAFSTPNGQQGTAAQETPTETSAPTALSAQSPSSAEAPASTILIAIDKPAQEMKVFVDNVEQYTWAVSTGLPRYDTPSGTYTARSMNKIWYSKQWDDAPMPNAIFFTKKGHAIHGTDETKRLGRPASHGCVRLAPNNARTLFALVKEKGLENTEIVLTGQTPSSKAKVARPGPRKQQIRPPAPRGQASVKQQIRPPKKSSEIVPDRDKSWGEASAVTSGPRKQRIRPPQAFAYPSFDARELEKPRRLRRRERRRLYYSGPPQILPPQDNYKPSLGPRRFLRRY
jgi:lipoprotein-anchoring transpeptidase ErfK/SrfK